MKFIRLGMLLLICFTFGCKKDGYVTMSTDIYIKPLNVQGQDLLNSPALFNKDNIIVTQFKNGLPEQYNGSSEKGFIMGKDFNGLKILKVFPTLPLPESNERTTITLIQFGNTKADTIRSEFEIDGGSVTCTKVWFNSELKVAKKSSMEPFDRTFTVVK